MAFTPDTKIFTSTGWSPISNLRGHDRVLVRNFLGDAEFIQPFALKKRDYTGEIVTFGGKDWALSVTPDHKIVYNSQPNKIGQASSNVTANDVIPSHHELMYRSFRYNQENKRSELIQFKENGIKWNVSVSIEDWYTIICFTILFGYVSIRKRARPSIMYIADAEKLLKLTSIFDSIGLQWSLNAKSMGAPQISVRNTSNLVGKLKTFTGSYRRRDMHWRDKAIYGSSRALIRHFIDTLIALDTKPIVERPGQHSFSTINEKFMKNLEILCLLGGYGFSYAKNDRGLRARIITDPMKSWRVSFVEKKTYSGYVYELDLFEGLVYVIERSFPVWASPK
jgi:hypothetical protein